MFTTLVDPWAYKSQQLLATTIDIGAVANMQQLSLVSRPFLSQGRGGEVSGNVTSCNSHFCPGYFLHGY